MRRPLQGLAGLLIAAAILSACETTDTDPATAEPPASQVPAVAIVEDAPQTAPAKPESGGADTASIAGHLLPVPGSAPTPVPAAPVPHIYMALQPDGEGKPISAIFAIDTARDNTPSDDPAIRLTPENGLCNPQEMRSFDFPPDVAAAPVATEADQARGLTAADLPAFMAVSVTDRMLASGLATDREETRALNICTRKLWEELVLSENRAVVPAGQ